MSAFSPDSATTSRRHPSAAQSRSQKGETRRRRGRRPAPSLLNSPLGDPLSALEGKGWEPGKGREGPLAQSNGGGQVVVEKRKTICGAVGRKQRQIVS